MFTDISTVVSAKQSRAARLCAAVFLLSLSTFAYLNCMAAERPGKEELSEIVVTATRIPTSPSQLAASADLVIVDDKLRAFQGIDFTEVLNAIPGLFVQSNYNAAQDLRIDLRGFGARGNFGIRGIRVFVDGIPAGLPDGQVQVDSLEPAEISSVEVLRGPAAAQYGNGAGGVILIRTRALAEAPAWQLSTGLGENGFRNYSGGIALKETGGPLAMRITASRLALDGHRQQARSDHRRMGVQMLFDISARDNIEIRARATDAPLSEDPGGLNLADFRMRPHKAAANNLLFDAGEALTQQTLALRWRRSQNEDAGAWEFSNYYTWRTFENRLPFRDGGAVTIDRRLAGASLQYGGDGPLAATWVAGAEVNRQQDNRRRFDNNFGIRGSLGLDQEEIVTASGVFIGSDHALGWLSLQAALRYDLLRVELRDAFLSDGDDSGSRSFGRLSSSVGVRRDLGSSASVFARFASGFDTPTTTELANPAGAGFNSSLNPQTSDSYELGMHITSERKLWPDAGFAVYQVDTRDELVAYELPGQPGRSFFENAGSSRRRGVEATATLLSGERFNLRLSASWVDAVFRRFVSDGDDFSGSSLPGTPGLRIASGLDWQLRDSWRLGLDIERVAKVYADNANSVRSPDYVDASARIAWGKNMRAARLELFMGIKNLLDRDFADNLRVNAFGGRYFEPAPGRYWYAGMRLTAPD